MLRANWEPFTFKDYHLAQYSSALAILLFLLQKEMESSDMFCCQHSPGFALTVNKLIANL